MQKNLMLNEISYYIFIVIEIIFLFSVENSVSLQFNRRRDRRQSIGKLLNYSHFFHTVDFLKFPENY